MSTFGGRMKEYRLVSLDRFDGENLSSTVYFLSHLHSDHTVGLDQDVFLERLERSHDSYLYCSTITRILLLGNEEKYGRLAPYVKPLEVFCPTTIDIPAACDQDQNSTVLVTLFPANHCLGSVMFLFEGQEGNVLYTGDFRWGKSEATHITYLNPSAKPLRSMYVDTTFCSPKAFHIPSREQCEAGVISLVESHFQKYGPDAYIWIESRTNFGYEMLLKEVSVRMKMKIHVAHWKKVLYDQISGLEDIFTENAEETRIHAHPENKYKRFVKNVLCCGYVLPNNDANLIRIKPSTMWFTTLPEITDVVHQNGPSRYRACYSFHSSYAEIRDLVQYLKPERVFPSVIPTSKTFDEIQDALNSFLLNPHYKHFSSIESEEQPLGIMKITKSSLQDSLSFGDCVFDDTQNQSANSQEENSVQNSQQNSSHNSQADSSVQNSQEGNSVQNSQSSYDGSNKDDSELDLYSSEESQNLSQTFDEKNQPTVNSLPLNCSFQSSCSSRVYVGDNSDSECEEEFFQNEHFKMQKDLNLSKSEDENKKCVETSPKEEMETKERSDSIQMSDVAGQNCEEWGTDVSKSKDRYKGQIHKTKEICSERSNDLVKIFGSQNKTFRPFNTESSHQDCPDRNVSAVFISHKNLEVVRSDHKPGVLKQTNAVEADVDCKISPASGTVNYNGSFSKNSVDVDNATKVKVVDNANDEMNQKGNKLKQNEYSCSMAVKLPEIEGSFFSSEPTKIHSVNKNESCSREKYRKMDLPLNNTTCQLKRILPEEIGNGEAVGKKGILGKKLEIDNISICQKENSSKEKPISATDKTLENKTKNKQVIKCDDTLSSFNGNKNSLNSKDMILQEENGHQCFGNKVLPIDSSMTADQTSNDAGEIKVSQESAKTDVSIEIIKEISNKQEKLIVEISESDDDDCVVIDSDSDKTLPPSPGFLESSQELFSSFDAITDPTKGCDLANNNEDVINSETI